MANYLPVLLVSVAANSIPDDSSVSTLPRGQVDYLSHNWEEEDVWRSWRNMTRQKNEIANGVRLENASWRTWWKQRNGLGTVTPETLNWLKDSDVTWLYGPLHTAVDWSPPPPKPITEPTSALDLTTTHKPILKYRSISQLLTSDLPTSPYLSPPQSDADLDELEPMQPRPLVDSTPAPGTRPQLTHTKSDTHITRWGPSRAFRKESPPRIDPPAVPHSPTTLDTVSASDSTDSNNPPPNARAASPGIAGGQQKKRHISFNTFVERCIAIEKPSTRVQYDDVDDDDEDDDDDQDDGDQHEYVHQTGRYPYGGRNAWGYDDGYEEDEEADSGDEEEEAVSLSMWDERYSGSAIANSDSDSYDGRDEDEDPLEVEDEDDTILDANHRRAPFRAPTTSARSQSKVSTASSSSTASTSTSLSSASSASTASTSSSSGARERRSSTSTTSTYRPRITQPRNRKRRAPPLIRTSTTEREPATFQTHVTIAPIAPTILKTGGGVGEWVEGFGDEAGGSDDGLWGTGAGPGGAKWWTGSAGVRGEKGGEDEMGGDSGESGTPVELVYVPPFGSNYSVRLGREREREREYGAKKEVRDVMEDHEDGLGNGTRGLFRSSSDQAVYRSDSQLQGVYRNGPTPSLNSGPGPRRRRSLFSVGVADDDEVDPYAEPPVVIPTVVVPREDADSGPFGYFGGSDWRRGRGVERGRDREERERSSRSRSRSKSRTPSPAVSPSTSIDTSPGMVSPVPTRAHTTPGTTNPTTTTSAATPLAPPSTVRRTASASPPTTASSLLAPPARGRGSSSHQDLGQVRGRSSTRTPSAGGSGSGGSRTGTLSAGGSSSSLGSSSLSPEGVVVSGKEGRGWREPRESGRDREGGRERERGGSRGRDRTGKRLSTSVSPEDIPTSYTPAHTYTPMPAPPSFGTRERERDQPRLNIVTKSVPPPAPPPPPRSEVSYTSYTPTSYTTSSAASTTSSAESEATVMPATPRPAFAQVSGMYRSPGSASAPVEIPMPISTEGEDEMGGMVTEEEKRRYMHPTPSNSPVISMQASARTPTPTSASSSSTPTSTSAFGHGKATTSTSSNSPTPPSTPSTPRHGHSSTKIRSPLTLPSPPHPAEPSTSYSISPPRAHSPPPPTSPGPTSPVSPRGSFSSGAGIGIGSPRSPRSPTSPTRGDGTIVGKAVGMVSSAGAFLGLWNGANATGTSTGVE